MILKVAIMLKIILFLAILALWSYFTFRDSDRDIAAWREKKYAKAVILFVLDNFVKVGVMAFLFPFVGLYFLPSCFLSRNKHIYL